MSFALFRACGFGTFRRAFIARLAFVRTFMYGRRLAVCFPNRFERNPVCRRNVIRASVVCFYAVGPSDESVPVFDRFARRRQNELSARRFFAVGERSRIGLYSAVEIVRNVMFRVGFLARPSKRKRFGLELYALKVTAEFARIDYGYRDDIIARFQLRFAYKVISESFPARGVSRHIGIARNVQAVYAQPVRVVEYELRCQIALAHR